MLTRLARWWLARKARHVAPTEPTVDRPSHDTPCRCGHTLWEHEPDNHCRMCEAIGWEPCLGWVQSARGECVCGKEDWLVYMHVVAALSDDDARIGIEGGRTAVSADFCPEHCPGGCLRGCVPSTT